MEFIAYQIEHSVDVDVSRSFAWKWRTDVRNWHDPPAQFHLDGAFEVGAWGTTLLPGREPLRWRVRNVQPDRSFIVEMPLHGAVLSFEWRFDAISDRRTRITQRIMLSGDNADAYASQVRTSFESTLAAGMKTIADALVRAARAPGDRGHHE